MDRLIDGFAPLSRELARYFDLLDRVRRDDDDELAKKFEFDVLRTVTERMMKVWTMKEVESLVEKLSAHQAQLSLRLLEYLSLKVDKMGTSLERQYSRVVEVLTVSEDKMDILRRQNVKIERQLAESQMTAKTHHERTLAAILTLENGESKFLTPVRADGSYISDQPQKFMTLYAESKVDGTTPLATIGDFAPIQKKVLASLNFRERSDRYDSVKDVHRSTYDWVFQQSNSDEPSIPWSPFVDWLETGRGCYWINGKAGSGKSTLAKFIHDHPTTQTALRKWAESGRRELCTASFFFWNLGSAMQKSQVGLLRSLLYTILQDRPYLISIVMPELWSMIGTDPEMRVEAPSRSQLLRWFGRLPAITESQLRICILIDGIDEYDGDFHDIISLVQSISRDDHIKFIVSSRPIPSCVDAFRSCHSLRLQDLTKNDILSYARDHLRERLMERYGTTCDNIITQIQVKSYGVFLWVILVVRSVLVGIENWDSIDEIRGRLDELPSGLKDLYGHMLQRMPHAYRQQASELFQIRMHCVNVQHEGHRMTPLQLYFANFHDEATLNHELKPLSSDDEKRITTEVEGRLRSRCCGLLEVQRIVHRTAGFLKDSAILVEQFYVDFIHRTAVEFFRMPGIWDDLVSLTDNTPFHPGISLFRSCVLLCKIQSRGRVISVEDNFVWYYMNCAIEYASHAEDSGCHAPTSLLLELDRVVSAVWKSARQFTNGRNSCTTSGRHWAYGFTLPRPADLFPSVTNPTDPTSFFNYYANPRAMELPNPRVGERLARATQPLGFHSVAVINCLNNFIAEHLPHMQKADVKSPSLATRLLFDSLSYILADDPTQKPWDPKRSDALTTRCASICSQLLSYGANPNEPGPNNSATPWDKLLSYGAQAGQDLFSFQRRYREKKFPHAYGKLLVVFLRTGADPTRTVVWDEGRARQTRYSVLKLVDALFSRKASSLDPYGDISVCPTASEVALDNEVLEFHAYLTGLIRERIADAGVSEGRVRSKRESMKDYLKKPSGWIHDLRGRRSPSFIEEDGY
jgi:hypothetical protein